MSFSDWETTTLGEISEIVMGQSPSGDTCNILGDGLPLLNGPTEFGNSHPVPLQFTTDPKKYAEPGDLLFCVRGSTTGRMNWANQRYAIGRGLAALRHRAGKDFQPFLRGLVDFYLPTLLIEATGSTFPNVSSSQLNQLEVDIPDLPTQKRIAGILSALDEKIELNRQTNATLEAIAQAIFKEWFINEEVTSEWELVALPEIIDLNPRRYLIKEELAPYLDMTNVPTEGHRAIEWLERQFSSGTRFANGDTLLARITPCLENGKTAFVDFLDNEEIGWGSTEFIVLRPKPPLPPAYGYYLARSKELRKHAILNMVGSSGRQRVPTSSFDNFLVPLPPIELAEKFGSFAKDLMNHYVCTF